MNNLPIFPSHTHQLGKQVESNLSIFRLSTISHGTPLNDEIPHEMQLSQVQYTQ